MAVFLAGTITTAVTFTMHVAITLIVSIELLMAHSIFATHRLHFHLQLRTRLLHGGAGQLDGIICLNCDTG